MRGHRASWQGAQKQRSFLQTPLRKPEGENDFRGGGGFQVGQNIDMGFSFHLVALNTEDYYSE
jgi:hypothetical protein